MSHLQSSVWPAVADQIKSRSVGAVKGNLHNLTDETSNINGVAQPYLIQEDLLQQLLFSHK